MKLQPKKSLGQHFLHDPNMIRKVAGTLCAEPRDPVVEIGPGTGALTGRLAARYDDFTAIEIDERAVAALREEHPNVDVRHTDILETDWSALAREKGRALHVIGNLPYNITSPILFSLLDARDALSEAVLMMQREVAERLTVPPGNKRYGAPSVQVQLLAEPELLFRVSRHVFEPKPNVESAVVRLSFGEDANRTEGVEVAWLRTLVRAAFGQRRKMLRNSLRKWTKDQGIAFPNGWDRKRAEALSPEQFVELARHLDEAGARVNG